MDDTTRALVRGALLLAIGAAAQQLRLLLPLPPMVLTLVIGTVVNCTLVLTSWTVPRPFLLLSCFALPVLAAFQGHIQMALIPVVFLGNGVLGLVTGKFRGSPYIWAAPFVKTLMMGLGAWVLLHGVLQVPEEVFHTVFKALVPVQAATGILGIVLARAAAGRLRNKKI